MTGAGTKGWCYTLPFTACCSGGCGATRGEAASGGGGGPHHAVGPATATATAGASADPLCMKLEPFPRFLTSR